ncbi:DUF3006 domain-containing protein [Candidatus Falkowbacteria bacterium]|jgi:hypothetical protein|nr:DUF3006 domain-containing protein [Candidatus Falkowbacteria bacterium]MBT7007006.1 DUF3006 domain-containing protein [Candidatus Falkowbacteria bacterium]
MKGIIDRIEEGVAVIKLNNGEQINYPVDDLLFDIKEGDAIDLLITKNETNTIEAADDAKNFLNDILKD